MNIKKISIIIPVYNERKNIKNLSYKLIKAMESKGYTYELIFIDDHSQDGTFQYLKQLERKLPLKVKLKQGLKGKAFSLLQGFDEASFNTLAMIDGDLQYPPSAIPKMIRKLQKGYDVVVANRRFSEVSFPRKIFSRTFSFIFTKLLHKLDCDVQSGLKVFRKKVINKVKLNPSQWTFDLEFLLKARTSGYQIGSEDIFFRKRKFGKSNINLFKTSWEIGFNAIKLKFAEKNLQTVLSRKLFKNGFYVKNKKFTTYNSLALSKSAFYRLSKGQKIFLLSSLGFLTTLFIFNRTSFLILLFSLIIIFYFSDLLFNLFLVYKGFYKTSEVKVPADQLKKQKTWPFYTVLCPLFKEHKVLPQFIKAISNLDYPKDKLEVILLLEENDSQTLKLARSLDLPSYFKIKVVPYTQPQTKPKACNYGLRKALGKYVVIYDAEDVPEPDQLKKAVLAFQQEDDDVVCLQAKLNYYNRRQNLLTRLFTLEYSFWFDLVLSGLHSIKAPIPLGGTSNHFKTKTLKKIHGWDAFNVTEDADLGIRLFKEGYKTAVIDSTTYEEANSQLKNWFRQRSRWIKGYMQTYFVHTRNLKNFLNLKNSWHFLTFQMVVGMKVISLLLNPLLWLLTVFYFALRPLIGDFIDSLFPSSIFYLGAFTLFIGNFFYIYFYALGVAKRKLWSLVIYTFFVPFYWIFMSLAAVFALWELIVKPYYWQKTKHGLHLGKMSNKVEAGRVSYSFN